MNAELLQYINEVVRETGSETQGLPPIMAINKDTQTAVMPIFLASGEETEKDLFLQLGASVFGHLEQMKSYNDELEDDPVRSIDFIIERGGYEFPPALSSEDKQRALKVLYETGTAFDAVLGRVEVKLPEGTTTVDTFDIWRVTDSYQVQRFRVPVMRDSSHRFVPFPEEETVDKWPVERLDRSKFTHAVEVAIAFAAGASAEELVLQISEAIEC